MELGPTCDNDGSWSAPVGDFHGRGCHAWVGRPYWGLTCGCGVWVWLDTARGDNNRNRVESYVLAGAALFELDSLIFMGMDDSYVTESTDSEC